MKFFYKFLVLLFAVNFSLLLQAQPQPCMEENPDMTPTCQEACIICDIDGFTGTHQSNIPGVLPDDFCTFVVHNAQWIAFQAASTDLTISLSVSNCAINVGLEMTIYESINCNEFQMISQCMGGMTSVVSPGSSALFTTTVPLVIGQYYYLGMDGGMGDNCDWTLNVIDGSTEVDPLTVTFPILGEDQVCPNTLQTYSTIPEEGAVLFDWTLNDQAVGDNTLDSIQLSFDNPGLYNLCVTAKNACDEALPTCQLIEVAPIPPTEVPAVICEDECYELEDSTFCVTGNYSYTYQLDNGCDSIILLDLTVLQESINNLSFNICEDDSIFIGETPYFTTGQHSETLQNQFLCDSTVNLDLTIIVCDIVSNYSSTSTVCFGDANGTLTFGVENGTPPFTYTWLHLQDGLDGNGNINNLNQSTIIENLPAGEVVIQIEDTFGNADVLIANVVEPAPLILNSTISNYNGFEISCNNHSDGSISISPSGGQMPYTTEWFGDNDPIDINNLPAGIYSVHITDGLGCELEELFELNEPDPIDAIVQYTNPNCSGIKTGQISVPSTIGGVGNYSYSLNGSPFNPTSSFNQLSPNFYTIEVKDDNDCIYLESNELLGPQIPELSGDSLYNIQLGCPQTLSVNINDINIESIQWTGE